MKGWCGMSRWILCLCSFGLCVSVAVADDPTNQSQIDAAYARLKGKEAASTQPATISVADLNGLRAELAQLRAENVALRVALAKLTAEIAAKSKVEAPTPAANAPPPNTVVLSRHDFVALPKDVDGKPLGFHELKMGNVGFIIGAEVKHIEDEQTMVVSILLDDNGYGQRGLVSGTEIDADLIIQGVPTAGLSDAGDKPGCNPNCWFKVVGTKKLLGNTYFIAEPIVEEK